MPPATSAGDRRARRGSTSATCASGSARWSTGGVVEYDPRAAHYRAAAPSTPRCLTRAARPEQPGGDGAVDPAARRASRTTSLDCFERGGGVPYSAYGRFHAVMAEESDQTVVAALRGRILPLVPGLPAALERGIDVLDVGCGSGRAPEPAGAARSRRAASPASTSRAEAIAAARAEARERGLAQRALRGARRGGARARRGASTSSPPSTRSTTRRGRTPVLAAIAAALRPDGVFLMQDIGGTSRVEDDAATRSRPSSTRSRVCTA